jgi:hypothetical protein
MLILIQIERSSRNFIEIIYNSGSAKGPKEALVLNAGMAQREFPFPYQSYPTMGSNVGLGQRIRDGVLLFIAFNCLLLFFRGVQKSRFPDAPFCNPGLVSMIAMQITSVWQHPLRPH